MKERSRLSLGIDIGSTTAKVVVVEDKKIVFEQYQRHFSQVRRKTLELLQEAAAQVGERHLSRRHGGLYRPDGDASECDGGRAG